MDKGKNSDVVLDVHDLKTYFRTYEGEVRAVDGVTFTVRRGRTLALVGESGCGKSVTAYSILRLIQRPGRIVSGKVMAYPKDGAPINVTDLPGNSDLLYVVRGGLISMIFQEPMTALSPVHTIGNQICEGILLHQNVTKEAARKIALDNLGKVGIPAPELRIRQYPHELSGGMRQRAVIAMAVACSPELLIADEPTTALDVTTQSQILKLIRSLQEQLGMSVLLITHDLGVVAQTAHDVAVMYLGRVVEQSDVRSVLKSPRHPYTIGLLKSLPSLSQKGERLPSIRGTVPSMADLPAGCPFHPRCPYMQEGRCDIGGRPPLQELAPGHRVACLRAEEIQP